MNNTKAVLILSGGLDSTTLLYWLLKRCYDVSAISFDYGQTHSKELDYALRTTIKLNVEHEIISLKGIFAGSALTDDLALPKSDYSVETMKATVVPNRNMVMLSIALSKAIQMKARYVAYGAHAGDNEVYPDCRPAFVTAMNHAASLCDWNAVSILAPFLSLSKKQVAQIANDIGVPIKETWSCYAGGEAPCGECGACKSRQDALA